MRVSRTGIRVAAGFLLVMIPQVRLAAGAPTTDFYVAVNGNDANDGSLQAPFATLAQAQQAVRQKIAAGLTGDVQVYVRGGTYALPAPLQFTTQDSGTAQYSISYMAYPGEKPVLSGGQQIQGWQNTGGNIWTVQLPQVQAGQWNFNQLFVNDQRATIARTPVAYPAAPATMTSTSQVVQLQSSSLPVQNWNNLSDVQLVSNITWSSIHKNLQSVNAAQNSVTLAAPHLVPAPYLTPTTTSATYLRNAIEFLDAPGEWYVNKQTGVLSYYPRSGEDMTKAAVYAPKLTSLLTVQGTASQSVENLHFVGLQFEHADWQMPATGFYGVQAGTYSVSNHDSSNPLGQFHALGTRPMPAAIQLRYVKNSSVENGAIKHVGAAGIALVEGDANVLVQGNNIYDTGGNGVNIGDYNSDAYANGSGYAIPSSLVVSGIKISNNNIHHVGADYTDAVGIWTSFADNTLITHNLVHDTPYTGISVGFDWGTGDTPARQNIVSANHVYNVMQQMADGGGIYTLGKQPGTVLDGNLVNGVRNMGIYLDEGSQQILVQNNITYDVVGNALFFHCNPSDNTTGTNYFDVSPGSAGYPVALANQAGLEPQFLWVIGVPEPSMLVLVLTGLVTALLAHGDEDDCKAASRGPAGERFQLRLDSQGDYRG